ncbi:MAG TPA: GNAT family protein [Nevskiaceae bacterium]|nr:GNAT family protein [Nevskiaceae bacterium]
MTLQGRFVTLEPLSMAHHAALVEAGRDAAIFQWYPAPVAGEGPMREFIESSLADQAKGLAIPFAVRTRHDGAVVGSSRFGAIDAKHARAEIGWTWYAPHVQRTPVNTECKRLMLAHGFDTLGYRRIEFKTDSLNAASRAALARIGAVEEGTFRNHMITASGRQRHSVYFSIIREDWPAVRDGLDARLSRPFSFAAPVTS